MSRTLLLHHIDRLGAVFSLCAVPHPGLSPLRHGRYTLAPSPSAVQLFSRAAVQLSPHATFVIHSLQVGCGLRELPRDLSSLSRLQLLDLRNNKLLDCTGYLHFTLLGLADVAACRWLDLRTTKYRGLSQPLGLRRVADGNTATLAAICSLADATQCASAQAKSGPECESQESS